MVKMQDETTGITTDDVVRFLNRLLETNRDAVSALALVPGPAADGRRTLSDVFGIDCGSVVTIFDDRDTLIGFGRIAGTAQGRGLAADTAVVQPGRAVSHSESAGAGVGVVAAVPSDNCVSSEDPTADMEKREGKSLCFVRGMLYGGSGDVPDRDMLAAVAVYATKLGDNYIDAGLQLTDGWGGGVHLDIGCRPQDVRRHIAAIGTIMAALKELQDALVRVAQEEAGRGSLL